MRQESGFQRVVRTPANDQRMQAMFSVELIVLERVDDIEADEPKDDGHGQDQGKECALLENQPSIFDGKELEAAFERQPRAEGRERQGEAEEEEGKISHALGVSGKTDKHQ